ncbi:MAG TPA: deoxyhypusine synthase family protein [Pirellulales bacterium]|jgi:deoxyhypusine synthase|nr:deoxyhypusine synthase family protein [Pirellulales bacterium]
MNDKQQLLSQPIQHIDITRHDVVALVEAMQAMAYTARDLHRAADIYDRMLRDDECGIILCLAGSLISAGLKKIFVDMIRNRMVDAIVSTGANIVDQDFFEGLGFKHYVAPERYKAGMDDDTLRGMQIDRIYDTLIDEDELRICDDTTRQIADELPPRPHSSREFIQAMGAWLDAHRGLSPFAKRAPSPDGRQQKGTVPFPPAADRDSIVLAAYEHDVPIFCPAFSDCSAGFGLVAHQHARGDQPKVSIDSVKDFYELTQLKIKNPTTGIFMIGGGVPKNFTQDIVVAADVLGHDAPMHKYAVQITVADVRDGALSSSTLKEASSWGKVDTAFEQMVFSEATLALPLIAGYAYHKGAWKSRTERRWSRAFETVAAVE